MSSRCEQSPNGNESRRVLELLRRQRDLYRGLQQMAGRQRSLIVGEDQGSLLALLGRRRLLTDSLLEIGRELAPLRSRWTAWRESLAAGERAEAEGLIAEVQSLLGEIMNQDEEDARLLSSRKSQVAEEVRSLRTDRRAVAAYAATTHQPRSRLDRMSEDS